MTDRCTIVMYHYVRPLAGSRIKGLDVADFDGQLDYLARHYHFITVDDLLMALDGKRPLPPMSVLLTFDDGIIDHYTHVFPRLAARGITGAFYPPASVVRERRLLDVHKVHHILASDANAGDLASAIDRACLDRRAEFGLDGPADYRSRFAVANRFDPAEVIYVKRMLQHALPEALRAQITDTLFRAHVSADERVFADGFYVSATQLREMIAAGMHVGSHGDTHLWLGRQDKACQAREISASADFLRDLGVRELTICYPYGDQNEDTLEAAADAGFAAGLTTIVEIARIEFENRLTLERLDTNDLPRTRDAPVSTWTEKAQEGQ